MNEQPDRDDELLTIDEAAAVARVHPVTIRRWIHSGALAALRQGTGPRTVRIRRGAVMAEAAVSLAVEDREVRG